MSTLNRKAWGDLTRHRARTLLAMFTLAIAIASLSFFAVPALLDGAMGRQVRQSHLYDVAVSMHVLDLSAGQLRALGRLPGVAAVSPALGYTARATSAAGTEDVLIAGTALSSAPVDTIPLLSGRLPGPDAALADGGNARATDYATPIGSTLSVRAADGRTVRVRISGTGINLYSTPGANGSTTPVFYATPATVESLAGQRGYNFLGFRLTRDTTAEQNRVIAEVRRYLTAQTGSDPITALPQTRDPGQWPGQSAFKHEIALLYIITILALLSALFLISATMNSLIAEQASEIAILKTLGGRRRQISGIVVRSAAMLGTAAAIPGTIVGIALAYLLVRYFAIKLIDVPFGFAVSVPVVVASLLLGPVIAVLAALPALRRALRRPVAETLAGGGATAFGSGWLDRLVARGGGRRLPGSLRMGVRNVLRQKRRSVATIAQVAVAVGLAVAMLALGQSLAAVIGQTIGKLNFSVAVGMSASKDAKPFGSRALAIAKGVPGVASAQPVETSSVQYDGQTYTAWGMVARPLYAYRLSGGRWFTAGETAATARSAVTPVVLGPSFARSARARVGQVLTLDMAVGLVRARVVGIDTGANDGGAIVYFPLPVLERLDGGPGTADSMWVRTASSSHAAVNRVATALAAKLDAAGYAVTTSKIYVIDAQDTASVAAILTIVEILGLLVVAIMLIGLASGLSMGIMERTREVGILRCVGARSRDIRRVFSTEAIVLALAGWVVGILLGWLIFQGLAAAVRHSEQISLPETFSPVVPLVTLVGLIVLTLLVIRGPLRRATRVQPGLALRYQ